MTHRTFEPTDVLKATYQCRDDLKGEAPDKWLSDTKNIAILHDEDVGLFEYRSAGIYCGHYLFQARGRAAVDSAHKILDYLFDNLPVNTIIGFTPMDKKGALWMTRHLGFTHQGDEDILGRMHRVSTMTRKDWNEFTSRR